MMTLSKLTISLNDTEHDGIQHKDIQQLNMMMLSTLTRSLNDTQHKDIQHKGNSA
jgi:hypothetical protein